MANEDYEDGDDAMTHNDSVTCGTPIITENIEGEKRAGRGVLFWDADDPLVLGLHFEVMMNSLIVEPEMFPLPECTDCEEDEILVCTCVLCGEGIRYGLLGALVESPDDPDTGLLLCLMCAEGHNGTDMEEALWLVGRQALESCLLEEPQDVAPAGPADVRCWRCDTDNYQIALRNGDGVLFLTMPLDQLQKFVDEVRKYEAEHGSEVESYLEGGFAALENLANGGIS